MSSDQAERDLAMVIGCGAAREVRALIAAMIAEQRSIKLPEVSTTTSDRIPLTAESPSRAQWFPKRDRRVRSCG